MLTDKKEMKSLLTNNWEKILLILLGLTLSWPIFVRGYFSHHDDLQVIRIFEMRNCLVDLQIPCRWVSNMGNGYGFPLFNYYNPLPYYIGGLASFITGYVNAAKLLFLIPAVFSGLAMYLFVEQLTNKKTAILAGALYTLAPYRALDLYVRGAIGESFAILIVPLLFYMSLLLTKDPKPKHFIVMTLVTFAFLVSHNVSVVLWAPVFLIWFIYLVYKYKLKAIWPVVLSVLIGIGISSFFVIPAFMERDLVTTENLISTDLDFRNHFVSYKQLLFDREWGYGASVPGPEDDMSFQVGYPHWLLAILAPALFLLKRKNLNDGLAPIITIFTAIFLLSLFMTHNKSSFVWENFSILQFVQFPWRYLSITIFASSILGGLIVYMLDKQFAKAIIIILFITTFFLNWHYFKPQLFFTDTNDVSKLSGRQWDNQIEGSMLDYLPKGAIEMGEKSSDYPRLLEGDGDVAPLVKKTNSWQAAVNLSEDGKIIIPVYDFPIWRVRLNGKEVNHSTHEGLILLDLPDGENMIDGKLENTPIRTVSNAITLLSLAGLPALLIYGKSRKILR